MSDKVVLAYSGGLDTSVAIRWLKENYELDVIALAIDVGNERDFSAIQQKALKVGAIKSLVKDAKELFVNYFIFPALQADALYEGQYPLATALSRPLMAKLLVDTAVEEEVVTETSDVFCPGYFTLPGGGDARWRCWREYGHGRVALVEAFLISCDVFFYEKGSRLGITKIAAWARRFHLGLPTGIDIPYEKAEPFPSRATVRPWYPGYTVNTTIGQGDVLVTPIQLAVAMAAVANGGTLYEPHIAAGVVQSSSPQPQIEPILPEVRGKVEASPEAWNLVRRGLWEVVNTYNGTGRRCRIEGFTIMGKTGTAQQPPYEPHAWYVCFGPTDGDNAPEIVVVVMLEHGGHGGEMASPLAKEFLEFYLSGGRKTIA